MKNKSLLTISLMVLLAPALAFSQKVESKNKEDHFKIKDPTNFDLAKNALFDGKWVFERGGFYGYERSYQTPQYGPYPGTTLFILNADSCQWSYNLDRVWSKIENAKIKITKKGRVVLQLAILNLPTKWNMTITLIGDGSAATLRTEIIYTKSAISNYSGKIIPLKDSKFASELIKQ